MLADPSLVFSEFMGVIKGSALALDRTDRCLDRQTYETLSHRTQSTFSGQRGQIYALFKSYVKRKQEKGQYDAADRQVSSFLLLYWDLGYWIWTISTVCVRRRMLISISIFTRTHWILTDMLTHGVTGGIDLLCV